MLGDPLREGNKDHLLNQARSAVSMSFSNKLMLKDWNYRTPITDILNLEENNLQSRGRGSPEKRTGFYGEDRSPS